jgi:hypothetical protein
MGRLFLSNEVDVLCLPIVSPECIVGCTWRTICAESPVTAHSHPLSLHALGPELVGIKPHIFYTLNNLCPRAFPRTPKLPAPEIVNLQLNSTSTRLSVQYTSPAIARLLRYSACLVLPHHSCGSGLWRSLLGV